MGKGKVWTFVLLLATAFGVNTLSSSGTQLKVKKINKHLQRKTSISKNDTIASNLLADGFKTVNKLTIEKEMHEEINKRAELEESLLFPSVELYGESNWGDYVNPFIGTTEKIEIPDTYDIDCNGFIFPLKERTRVTSHFGYRRKYRRQHKGIDLDLRTGDTIYAAFDGKVRIVEYEGRGYGKYVVIRHNNGLETVYGHMSKQLVKKNDIVRAGDPIGLGGSTGRSTGSHLHFETRFMGIAINPATLIDFELGVPQKDIYTFHKRGYNTMASLHNYKTIADKKHIAKNKKNIVVHRIRKGDTLSGIAQKHGVSVAKICQLNKISSKAILRPGKTLRII